MHQHRSTVAYEDSTVHELAAETRRAVAADLARYAPVHLRAIPTPVVLMLAALSQHDGLTYLHSLLVARRAVYIARVLDLLADEVNQIYLAGLLHDIGMLTIRRSVLQKPGPLSPAEWDVMRMHPQMGAQMVQRYAELRSLSTTMARHHERPDGLGYPAGLLMPDIPLSARIITISEAIESMRLRRPYASTLTINQIRTELWSNRGTVFDSDITVAALQSLRAPTS